MFWNWPINFIRDSYVVVSICCLYNTRYIQWHNDVVTTNSALAIGLLVMLLIYPLCLQLYLYRSQSKLKTEAFKHRCFAAYDRLATEESKFILQPIFYYYRCLLIPASVIIWPKFFIMQYFALILTSLAIVMLIGYKQPFSTKAHNTAELV